MVLAEPGDDADVVEEVALYFLRDLEYGEWEAGCFWCSHCCCVEEVGPQTPKIVRLSFTCQWCDSDEDGTERIEKLREES